MNECPQCGSTKSWHFSEGESASSIWDRFDKVNPNTGNCWKCKFGYSEHICHSLEEQIATFREKRKRANKKQNENWDKQGGKMKHCCEKLKDYVEVKYIILPETGQNPTPWFSIYVHPVGVLRIYHCPFCGSKLT